MCIYSFKILVIAFLFTATAASAAPTEDQVRQASAEKSIQNWKNETAKIADLKSRLSSTPFHEAWTTLDDLVKSTSGTKATVQASNPRNDNELKANASWLRWKILTDKADGRYSYTYSYLLAQMKNQDSGFIKEAVVFFYHGRLAITVDGARCADRSSANYFINGYETQQSLQPVRDEISRMTPSQRAAAILEAVAIEETVGERPPYEWLCVQGVRTMRRALEQGRTPQKVDGNGEGQRLGGQGNTYSVDTSDMKAELVAEEEWKHLRRKVLDNVSSGVAKNL